MSIDALDAGKVKKRKDLEKTDKSSADAPAAEAAAHGSSPLKKPRVDPEPKAEAASGSGDAKRTRVPITPKTLKELLPPNAARSEVYIQRNPKTFGYQIRFPTGSLPKVSLAHWVVFHVEVCGLIWWYLLLFALPLFDIR